MYKGTLPYLDLGEKGPSYWFICAPVQGDWQYHTKAPIRSKYLYVSLPDALWGWPKCELSANVLIFQPSQWYCLLFSQNSVAGCIMEHRRWLWGGLGWGCSHPDKVTGSAHSSRSCSPSFSFSGSSHSVVRERWWHEKRQKLAWNLWVKWLEWN